MSYWHPDHMSDAELRRMEQSLSQAASRMAEAMRYGDLRVELREGYQEPDPGSLHIYGNEEEKALLYRPWKCRAVTFRGVRYAYVCSLPGPHCGGNPFPREPVKIA